MKGNTGSQDDNAAVYIDRLDDVMDDNFSDGMCSWDMMYMFPSSDPLSWFNGSTGSHYMAPTLSTRGAFGKYALRATTANVKYPYYGSTASIIKRMTHRNNTEDGGKIKLEYWFSLGANSTNIAGYTSSQSPRILTFGIDNMYPLRPAALYEFHVYGTPTGGTYVVNLKVNGIATATAAIAHNATAAQIGSAIGAVSGIGASNVLTSVAFGNNNPMVGIKEAIRKNVDITGVTTSLTGGVNPTMIVMPVDLRSFFQVSWIQSAYSAAEDKYRFQGNVNAYAGTGLVYGAGGYISPESNSVDTGYRVLLPFNQNKMNVQYFSMTVDCVTGKYIEVEFNGDKLDMTKCPAISGGSPLSMIQLDDGTYNVSEFNAGLNATAVISNISEGYPAMARLDIHRSRLRYV